MHRWLWFFCAGLLIHIMLVQVHCTWRLDFCCTIQVDIFVPPSHTNGYIISYWRFLTKARPIITYCMELVCGWGGFLLHTNIHLIPFQTKHVKANIKTFIKSTTAGRHKYLQRISRSSSGSTSPTMSNQRHAFDWITLIFLVSDWLWHCLQSNEEMKQL